MYNKTTQEKMKQLMTTEPTEQPHTDPNQEFYEPKLF